MNTSKRNPNGHGARFSRQTTEETSGCWGALPRDDHAAWWVGSFKLDAGLPELRFILTLAFTHARADEEGLAARIIASGGGLTASAFFCDVACRQGGDIGNTDGVGEARPAPYRRPA